MIESEDKKIPRTLDARHTKNTRTRNALKTFSDAVRDAE